MGRSSLTRCEVSAPIASWISSGWWAAKKPTPLSYDTCESCGGIFLESEFAEASDYAAAKKEIIGFFTRFSSRGKKKAAVHA